MGTLVYTSGTPEATSGTPGGPSGTPEVPSGTPGGPPPWGPSGIAWGSLGTPGGPSGTPWATSGTVIAVNWVPQQHYAKSYKIVNVHLSVLYLTKIWGKIMPVSYLVPGWSESEPLRCDKVLVQTN